MAKAWLRIFSNICNKLIYSRIQIQSSIPFVCFFVMLRIDDLPSIENIKETRIQNQFDNHIAFIDLIEQVHFFKFYSHIGRIVR